MIHALSSLSFSGGTVPSRPDAMRWAVSDQHAPRAWSLPKVMVSLCAVHLPCPYVGHHVATLYDLNRVPSLV